MPTPGGASSLRCVEVRGIRRPAVGTPLCGSATPRERCRRRLERTRAKSTGCFRGALARKSQTQAQGERVLGEIHRMNITGFLESIGRDLRRALRGLPRRPAFTIAAVLTLALGIGATTAIFSVVYSVLLKPLPYPNSGELVRIRHPASGLGGRRARHVARDVLHVPEGEPDVRRVRRVVGRWPNAHEWRRDAADTLASRFARDAAGARRAADARPLVHGAGARARGAGAGARDPVVCVLAEPVRRRRSGARARAHGRRAAIASRRHHAGGVSLRRHELAAGHHRRSAVRPRESRHHDASPA